MAVSEAPPTDRVAAVHFSEGYKRWVIILLILISASNFCDRIILNTVAQAIKIEFRLTDLQLGLLGGLAFAVLYSVVGIPIARLAETRSRVNIIVIATGVWSVMTALCGTGVAYWQLLLYRVGVGVGEAGFTPPTVSMLADYFPPNRRASAYSLVSLGIPIGSTIGAFLGGYVAQTYGWRAAFFIVGVPGLFLAVLAKLTLREPPRGHSEKMAVAKDAPPFAAVLKRLIGKPAFRHLALAAALTSFANYGINMFLLPHFMRTHELNFAQAGAVYGVITGVASATGALGGGFLIDWVGRRDPRWYALLPACALAVASPLYILGVLQPGWLVSAAIMLVSSVCFYAFMPSTMTTTQGLVEPRMRASTAAIYGLTQVLIGLGLGPVFMGWVSDLYTQRAFPAGDYHAQCLAAVAPVPGSALAQGCAAASADGLRYAIVTAACFILWAALHYFLASRTLRNDLQGDFKAKPAAS